MNYESSPFFQTCISFVGISTLAAACKSILTPEERTLIGFLSGIVLCGFVSVLGGLIIPMYVNSASMQFGIVGILSFCARYILVAILRLANLVIENPRMIVDTLLDWLFDKFRSPKKD